MLPMIRSEFRKLSTIRGPWLLLAAGPLLVVAGITGLVQSGADVHDPAVQSKALAHVGLAGAAAGLIASAVAIAVTAAWWAAKGGSFHLSASGTWQTVVGGVAANVAFAAIGVGVGALIRNLAAANAAALAWIAVVEGIVGQLLGSGLARWLPFYASEALDRTSVIGSARLLPQWGGGLLLAGYAAVFASAAIVTTLRRDVT